MTALTGGTNAVVVADGGRPVGVVTRSDLLDYLAHLRSRANSGPQLGHTRDSGYRSGEATRIAATATLAQIRRTIVGAQGFAGRYRRADEADVEAAIRRLSAVQLDSISTVDRAHRLTLSSRIGAFDPEHVPTLLAARAGLRVLGARGVAAADRALAAFPHGDGRPRALGLARPGVP